MARKQLVTSGVRVCMNHRDPANWQKVAAQNPRWVHVVCGKCNGNIAYEPIEGGKCSRLLEAAQGEQRIRQMPKTESQKPAPTINEQPSQESATVGELPISNRYKQTSLFG